MANSLLNKLGGTNKLLANKWLVICHLFFIMCLGLMLQGFYVSYFLLSFAPCEMESCTNIIINDDFCQLLHNVFLGDPTKK